MRIDTDIEKVVVEIEGEEYPVAERTVAIVEKMQKIRTDYGTNPDHKAQIEIIELLLGKEACKHLFKSGKNENIDRIDRIFAGCVKAFTYNSEMLAEEQRESKFGSINEQIKPITELMRQANAMNSSDKNNTKMIRRS